MLAALYGHVTGKQDFSLVNVSLSNAFKAAVSKLKDFSFTSGCFDIIIMTF